VTGSTTTPSVCTCETGFALVSTSCLPICGDSKLVGNEVCDDGALGGCISTCLAVSSGYSCSGGSASAPSTCNCLSGFIKVGTNCLPICGDLKVIGNEVCDDGGSGGCLADCSAANSNFTCTAGSSTTPSVCSSKSGYLPSGALCLSNCGDGLVASNEICDDAGKGGC